MRNLGLWLIGFIYCNYLDNQATSELAPGYIETMSSWIKAVISGNPPGQSLDALPTDERPTRPAVMNLQGFTRWEVKLGFFVAMQLAFSGYFVAAGVRTLRRANPQPAPARWGAQAAALLGLITSWGVYAFVGYTAATFGEGVVTVVLGRPLGWFVLQFLSTALLLVTIVLIISWYRERRKTAGSENIRLILLLVGVILFVPWAFWWRLFSI